MSGVNKVMILGNLGADPEVKQITGGNTVCKMTVATSEDYTDKNGQRQSNTEWHNVVVWGKLAELCGQYLSKGSQIFLEGRLQTRSWEDQQGQKKYTTEVIANKVTFIKTKGQGAQEEIPF